MRVDGGGREEVPPPNDNRMTDRMYMERMMVRQEQRFRELEEKITKELV